MPRLIFAIPGDLATLTGGYAYDRRVLAELPALGLEALHVALPGRFPAPTAADIAAARAAIVSVLREGDVVLVDGLALGAMGDALSRLPAPVVELCHHPLALEAGLAPNAAERLRMSERAALAACAHVIVTSGTTAEILARDFGVAPANITVALPGTDPVPQAAGSRGQGPVRILALGSIVPRKGFDHLIEALAGLPDLDWRLTLVGSPDRAPDHAAGVRARIAALGLEGRVELAGEITQDALERFWDGADVFVSSSLYEGYGMALAEALARGLPIVTTTGGAAADTVPDGAGLKVQPGDVAALRDALRDMIADGTLRDTLAAGAHAAGLALPRWSDTAATIADVTRRLAGEEVHTSGIGLRNSTIPSS